MKLDRICRAVIQGCVFAGIIAGSAMGQNEQGSATRESIDQMRDREQQPEKVMDAIGLKPGMIVGEAGAGGGFFTFKLSSRVGERGMVYANDILPDALRSIEEKCASRKIANVITVLGDVDDPLFPKRDLDMVIVFDCLFEFSQPIEWMKNTKSYLKPGGKLVIVDPDPSKIGENEDILSRERILEYTRAAGYNNAKIDDSFLKTHMIIVLAPAP